MQSLFLVWIEAVKHLKLPSDNTENTGIFSFFFFPLSTANQQNIFSFSTFGLPSSIFCMKGRWTSQWMPCIYRTDSYPPATRDLSESHVITVWERLSLKSKGFSKYSHCLQKVPVILHWSQVARAPWTHLWKNSQVLVLGSFILQGTAAWWGDLPGPQEGRCHCAGTRGIAYQKLAVSLMPPCPIWGLNSLIFPCPILDKISRTCWLSDTPHHPVLLKLSLVCYLGIFDSPYIVQIWKRSDIPYG